MIADCSYVWHFAPNEDPRMQIDNTRASYYAYDSEEPVGFDNRERPVWSKAATD